MEKNLMSAELTTDVLTAMLKSHESTLREFRNRVIVKESDLNQVVEEKSDTQSIADVLNKYSELSKNNSELETRNLNSALDDKDIRKILLGFYMVDENDGWWKLRDRITNFKDLDEEVFPNTETVNGVLKWIKEQDEWKNQEPIYLEPLLETINNANDVIESNDDRKDAIQDDNQPDETEMDMPPYFPPSFEDLEVKRRTKPYRQEPVISEKTTPILELVVQATREDVVEKEVPKPLPVKAQDKKDSIAIKEIKPLTDDEIGKAVNITLGNLTHMGIRGVFTWLTNLIAETKENDRFLPVYKKAIQIINDPVNNLSNTHFREVLEGRIEFVASGNEKVLAWIKNNMDRRGYDEQKLLSLIEKKLGEIRLVKNRPLDDKEMQFYSSAYEYLSLKILLAKK